MASDGLVVADVGNSRIKLVWDVAENPVPFGAASLSHDQEFDLELPDHRMTWVICSVTPTQSRRMTQWVADHRPDDLVHMLCHDDVDIPIEVDFPRQVGLDRLMAATAACQIAQNRDVVVIDAGTAVTVDAVSVGKFLGGTIFPGSQTEFEALRAKAEQLPLIKEYDLPESVIGKSTSEAIRSGVLYGQVGSIIYVAQQIAKILVNPVFVATGGGLQPIGELLPKDWVYVPGLVTDGIRMTAHRILGSS